MMKADMALSESDKAISAAYGTIRQNQGAANMSETGGNSISGDSSPIPQTIQNIPGGSPALTIRLANSADDDGLTPLTTKG